jgi:hypothetical protein
MVPLLVVLLLLIIWGLVDRHDPPTPEQQRMQKACDKAYRRGWWQGWLWGSWK